MSPLLFLILIPLGAIIFIMVGAPARFASIVATGLNLVLGLFLFARYDRIQGGWQYLSETALVPSLNLNFSLGADGLSLTMILLSTLVSFCAILISRQGLPLKAKESNTPHSLTSVGSLASKASSSTSLFYICLLLISAGLAGAFSSIDLFFFYGFHEVALIPVFLMIGIWGSGDRQAAAWKATLYLGAGSFIVLIGIVALYLAAPTGMRTFDLRLITEMSQSGMSHPASWIYLLFLVGFGTLVSLVPFHSWAPTTYANAPAPTAMLHAGVLKKFGLYGLLRLTLPIFPDAVAEFSTLLLILLTLNILYIGYVTIAQRHLDATVAYSSIMHMGTIFLGLISMNIVSLQGATLLMFAHGLSVAALFAICGALRYRTGTLDYKELGGLAAVLPKMVLLAGFVVMASIGLPGLANFAGEILIFFGAAAAVVMSHGWPALIVATVAAIWGVVISAIYMLRAYRSVFFGPLIKSTKDGGNQWQHLTDLSFTEFLGLSLLIVGLLGIGLFPSLILKMLTTTFS